MIDENKRLNIILGVICVVLVIVILYIINYTRNLDSAHVYFEVDQIKNINWTSNEITFTTNGKTFSLTKNGSTIYDNEKLELDTNTGKIIDNRLYLRSVGTNNIVIWYEEAEYRLDKK